MLVWLHSKIGLNSPSSSSVLLIAVPDAWLYWFLCQSLFLLQVLSHKLASLNAVPLYTIQNILAWHYNLTFTSSEEPGHFRTKSHILQFILFHSFSTFIEFSTKWGMHSAQNFLSMLWMNTGSSNTGFTFLKHG